MPRSDRIRWRASDRQKLRRRVRLFNRKRSSLIKRVPELEDILPARVSVRELEKQITTRRDFNNVMRRLERFSRRGAEEVVTTRAGVVTTRYQLKEISIANRSINARRAAERKRADVSTAKGTMGSIKRNELLPRMTDPQKVVRSEWERFIDLIERQSMDRYYSDKTVNYRKNYITALYNVFGQGADDLAELVTRIDPDVLGRSMYDDPVMELTFIYDPIEAEFKRELLLDRLTEMAGKTS